MSMWHKAKEIDSKIVASGLRRLAQMIEDGEAFLFEAPTIEIKMEYGPAMLRHSLSVVTQSVSVGEQLKVLFTDRLLLKCRCGHVSSVRSDLVQFECPKCRDMNYATNGSWRMRW